MFPVTRDILLYALGILVVLMFVLLVLVYRKRMPLMAAARKDEEPFSLIERQAEGGAYTKTGPVDLKSIKDKLLGEKKAEQASQSAEAQEGPPVPAPQARPQPAATPKPAEKPAPAPPPEQQPAPSPAEQPQPKPPPVHVPPAPPARPPQPEAFPRPPHEPTPQEEAREPVFEEDVIEEGIELHDHPEDLDMQEYDKYGPQHEAAAQPEPKPAPEQRPSAPPAPAKKDDYFVLEDDTDRHPVKAEARKPVKEKELAARGAAQPREVKEAAPKPPPRQKPAEIQALKPGTSGEQADFSFKKVEGVKTGTPVGSAEIVKDPKSFVGQTVSVQGDVQLSSKGAEDAWYVLFDKSGSSVLRSKEEIPLKRCKVTAKVEKTKLGQIYLDVIRYEKV
jgi:hypothetical protein